MWLEPSRPIRWRWVVYRIVPVIVVCLAIAAMVAIVPWIPHMPQGLRTRVTEGFLRGILIGYAVTLVVSLIGGGLSLAAFVRARRRGVRRPRLARVVLLSGACLFGLCGLELMSAGWLAWAHRLPRLPTRFAKSPADTVSLVVIGGSGARGFPYQPWLSFGQILGWQLENASPGRRVDVDVRAELGKPLEAMHQVLTKLERRPDAIIVYSGHNEFLARYEDSRDVGYSEEPRSPLLRQLYRASRRSWLCRVIYETTSKSLLSASTSGRMKHHLVDPPICTPTEYAAIVADFRRRLEAIVVYCERIGALPILVIEPGNDSGYEPNRSVVPPATSAAERVALTRAFDEAKALEPSDPARSLAGYQAIVARYPAFAEAHFRLGRLLEHAEDWPAAKYHYARARDADGFPTRCPELLQQAYRQVAARHDCLLIDGVEVLRAMHPHGLLDDHAFHDAQHPTLAANVVLAQAILDGLAARAAFGVKAEAVRRIDPAECAHHFAIDAGKWETVCRRSSTFYRDLAHVRFDPTERLDKKRRYARAAERIAAGVAPAETGIPGVGIPPRNSRALANGLSSDESRRRD